MKLLVAFAILYAIWWLAKNRGRGAVALSAGDARDLLDVPPGASRDDIVAAHRRLIARVHPDAGGSAALAARVNAARDVLIAEAATPPIRGA